MEEKQVPKPQINATVKKPNPIVELFKYAAKTSIEPRLKEMTRDMCTGTLNMFNDAGNKMIDKLIYPDGDVPRKSNSNGVRDYRPQTNYTVFSKSNSEKPPRETINTRSSIDVNYIWVDTENEAKYIVNSLCEEIDNYGKAKVSSLYEMVRIPTTFTDFKFGWTDTKGISYYRDRGKYFIDLPKPVNIENV